MVDSKEHTNTASDADAVRAASTDVESEGNGSELERSAESTDQKERQHAPPKPRLGWLVDDFNETANSVYEAVMISSRRARQIGRRQKQEIDNWNSAHDITETGFTGEEVSEPGVDHFNHQKPTVQALCELKDENIKFHYSDEVEK